MASILQILKDKGAITVEEDYEDMIAKYNVESWTGSPRTEQGHYVN